MRFNFYSPICFEKWDFRNSVQTGIGGSETSHCEMAWRLARRGHEVVTYAPIPDDCPGEWRGTKWLPIESADFAQPGIWIMYRCPDVMDRIEPRSDQAFWLLMQDWDYGTWTPERVTKLSRIIPLCHAHRDWLLKRHPEFAPKMWVTRNGVKVDLIEEVESQGIPERNPLRMMFASSPDRGLLPALKIFRRVKEFVPEAEFNITYGFNNIDKMTTDGRNPGMAKYKAECMKLVKQTGAIFHGRLTQQQLYREWLKTGILIYPTTFWETGWITGLEGQALGAIPVYSPIWAQGENTRFGFPIPGNPDDPLTLARFAAEIINLMRQPEQQESIRREMMPATRREWSWEQFVHAKPGENWEDAAYEDLPSATPRFSIITPSIHPEGLAVVRDCLASQTLTDWEWLIGTPERLAADTQENFPTARVFTEPHNPAHFYQLNKCWNHLVQNAKGRWLVFITDHTWFEPNTLAKLRQGMIRFPNSIISVPADHFTHLDDGKPAGHNWTDYRRTEGGGFTEINPTSMELVLAIVSRDALLRVGGFDESYDTVAGFSEKDLCCRLLAVCGIASRLDQGIECGSIVHGKPGNWDAFCQQARDRINEDLPRIGRGEKGILGYLHATA